MTSRFLVSNAPRPLDIEGVRMVVCSLGYEPRSTFVAESIRAVSDCPIHAVGYEHARVAEYQERFSVLEGMHAQVRDSVSDGEYRKVITEIVRSAEPGDGMVIVDISSLNRARIAVWTDLICTNSMLAEAGVRFLYSKAKFISPAADIVQNEFIGPISARSSGGLLDPSLPSALILGLGYEVGKAVGAVEYLQSTGMWIFIPSSDEARFEQEVRSANSELIDSIDPSFVVRYSIEDPAGTYADLCSLAQGLSTLSNPILLPLGPKIFALTCLLAGRQVANASVWRASQGKFEIPIFREPTGEIIGLDVRIPERKDAASE